MNGKKETINIYMKNVCPNLPFFDNDLCTSIQSTFDKFFWSIAFITFWTFLLGLLGFCVWFLIHL